MFTCWKFEFYQTLIDNGPFFFLLCEQKVSLQAEGRPETENEKPCNGDRIQGIYRQNSLLVLLNHVLTKKLKACSVFRLCLHKGSLIRIFMFLMFSYTFSEIFFFTFFEFYVIELMLYLRVQVNWYKLQLFQNFICGQVLHKYLSWLEIFEMVMTLQDNGLPFQTD